MPELPEVEIIKNDLCDLVIGRRIVDVDVPDAEIGQHLDLSRFIPGLVGKEIIGVNRQAKSLLIGLSSGDTLLVRLMVTGQLLLVDSTEPPRKSTRMRLKLDRQQELRLNDTSRLARVFLMSKEELAKELEQRGYGPEPISPEFTLERFKEILKGRRTMIKPLLLDQSFVSGIGNIYVDEILFAARINPTRKASDLSDKEIERLHEVMRQILRNGIRLRGTTVKSYRDVLGRKGNYQTQLKVFRKAGDPCVGCDGQVVKTFVGQRETFYCPSCQK
jgi:formamidopyrimidine-DNA glycosylase